MTEARSGQPASVEHSETCSAAPSSQSNALNLSSELNGETEIAEAKFLEAVLWRGESDNCHAEQTAHPEQACVKELRPVNQCDVELEQGEGAAVHLEPIAKDCDMVKDDVDSMADTPVDDRPKIHAGAVRFDETDTTINAILFNNASVLTSFREGSCQYLLAGARANTGIIAGKYMFEIKLLEIKGIQTSSFAAPYLRIGVSLAGSSLLMEHGINHIFFEAPASLFKQAQGQLVISVLLDRDRHALSMSCDNGTTGSIPGSRQTKNLPSSFRGKMLYPTVTYRNVMLQVNFGPSSVLECPNRPFLCRMIAEAAESDVEIADRLNRECEVLFPVGLPDQGVFGWADVFLSNNPNFMELSDRMLLDWLKRSIGHESKLGLWPSSKDSCIDKPNLQVNVPNFNPDLLRDTIWSLAPRVKRNYLVMELMENLTVVGRQRNLQRHWAGHRKGATVLISDLEHAPASIVIPRPDKGTEISQEMLSSLFDGFSLPAVKEGFDYIRYQFQPGDLCAELLHAYIASCRMTLPVASLKPSAEFIRTHKSWEKRIVDMRRSQVAWKKGKTAAEVPEDMDIDEVTYIEDVYKGGPLYANFVSEDWVLLELRCQSHLLLHALKTDVDDPERQHVHESNFSYYYKLYFGKRFDLNEFGEASFQGVFDMITDTVNLDNSTGVLHPVFDENVHMEKFVKLTYVDRSKRVQMYDAGDETALLNFRRKAHARTTRVEKTAATKETPPGVRIGLHVNASLRQPPCETLYAGKVFIGHVKIVRDLCFVICDDTRKAFGKDMYVDPQKIRRLQLSHGSKVRFTVHRTSNTNKVGDIWPEDSDAADAGAAVETTDGATLHTMVQEPTTPSTNGTTAKALADAVSRLEVAKKAKEEGKATVKAVEKRCHPTFGEMTYQELLQHVRPEFAESIWKKLSSSREHADASAHEVFTCTIKPGMIGFVLNPPKSGNVSKVNAGGQAHALGVKVGMQLIKVGPADYSEDALRVAATGLVDYELTFKKQVLDKFANSQTGPINFFAKPLAPLSASLPCTQEPKRAHLAVQMPALLQHDGNVGASATTREQCNFQAAGQEKGGHDATVAVSGATDAPNADREAAELHGTLSPHGMMQAALATTMGTNGSDAQPSSCSQPKKPRPPSKPPPPALLRAAQAACSAEPAKASSVGQTQSVSDVDPVGEPPLKRGPSAPAAERPKPSKKKKVS